MISVSKKNISDVVRNKLCNSCGACAGVCSKSAIDFRESIGGYLLPYIDYGKCTDCGLCFTCCPGIHFGEDLSLAMPSNPFQGAFLDTWVGKAEDKDIYRNSQSGGVVSALLSGSLRAGDIKSAVVVTMKMAKKPRPEVILVKTRDEVMNAQKSKYCPVPVLSIIKKIEDSDYPVAIVGLPCHIHGLFNIMAVNKKLLGKVKYTIGLICDRVMTYAGADFLVRKSGVDPDIDKLLEFRDKSYSGYPGHVKVMGKDKKPVFMSSENRTQLKDFFTPARCRLCFDKMNIFSDITIGDPHGVSGVDRKNGESLVIARTERGLAVVKKAIEDQSISLRRITFKEAADGQAVNKKMSDWRSYSEAWKELGFDLPDFYDTVKQNIIFSRSPRHLRELKFLLALNDFGSRDELFKVVDSLLRKRHIVKRLTYPVRVLFKIVGKIKKIGGKFR